MYQALLGANLGVFDWVFRKFMFWLFYAIEFLSAIHVNLTEAGVKILGGDSGEIMKSMFRLVRNMHGRST